MNSLMLFNGVVGGVFLVLYLLVFFLIGRKKGANLETTGLKLPFTQILKSLLLAVLSFAGIYAVVYACSTLSGTNFSFFKFNIMPMDSTHWVAFFKYLPVWLLFFLLCCLQALFHLNGMGFDIPAQLDGMPQLFEFLCEDANLRGIWLITVELLALF